VDAALTEVGVVRSQSFLQALTLASLLAGIPGCVVRRWSPLETNPETLDARHRRTVRAVRPDGSRLILYEAMLSGDIVVGIACRDPGAPRPCEPLGVPLSDLRTVEVSRVNVAASLLASVAATAGIALGTGLVPVAVLGDVTKGIHLPIPFEAVSAVR
jgi:hypothetical protein